MEGRRRNLAEHPVVVAIGLLAGLAGIIGLVLQLWPESGGGSRGGGNGGEESPTTPSAPPVDLAGCTDPALSLSVGSGPSGTEVVVSGTGFPGDESVDLRFHVEPLTPSRTDTDGSFQVAVAIPGTLDAFAPSTFQITAATSPAVCFADAPFELTEP